MQNLQIFKNSEFGQVRVVEQSGNPWFVGKDVTDILKYQNGSRDINRHVDEDDRTKIMLFDGNQRKETIVINESGLYSLILSSKMPEAKKFKRWVTSEVLPSIRKTGGYIAGQEEMTQEQLMAQALIVANNVIQERDKQLAVLKPKADYYDLILNNKGLVKVTSIAKDYGMSAEAFNKLLYELGIQYKQGGQWFLYHQYHAKGYTHSETVTYRRRDGKPGVSMITKWTQRGRAFLYKVLKDNGILPLIERDDVDESIL